MILAWPNFGCVASHNYSGSRPQYFTSPGLAESTQPIIEFGEPHPILDGIGWVIGIPSKIILWDRRIANHSFSPETEMSLAQYLVDNELETVKIRINQYAPWQDWQRLRANTAVGAGWRYTLGSLSILGEAVLPGRVFGYDHFNPFSNTVHVFSDVPAVALHEAGHAKDFAQRQYKGTYAAAYLLPGIPLWHEAAATNDVLDYLEARGDFAGQADAYTILYPAYGTYAGDAGGYLVPNYGQLVWAGAVVAGHVVGRVQAHRVRAEFGSVARQYEPQPSSGDGMHSTPNPPLATEFDSAPQILGPADVAPDFGRFFEQPSQSDPGEIRPN